MVCENCGTVFCWDEADQAPVSGNQRKRFCSEGCKKKASAKRARDTYRAWELAICERRGKKKYRDVVEAREAAGKVLQRNGNVTYPYRCVCGYWHLTKRPPSSTKDVRGYGYDVFITRDTVRSS